MKKISFALLLSACTAFALAQEKGMHFEHNTSWEKVLAKAKAENKFIFIDCYTTWCGPCKMMSKNIFPLEEVGKFYNEKFVNIKVQLDTTKEDNDEVKSWYAAGKELATKYNVRAYPTYLMFSPNGEIVHRAVGSSEADKFLAKGADAINPDKQYYGMKRKYENGKKDEKFLYELAKAANDAYDQPFSKTVTTEYLNTQKNLLTKENIEFLAGNINTSKDRGFAELLSNPQAFDKVAGPGFAQSTIRNIINREESLPILFPKGQKAPEFPDWAGALKAAAAKYPKEGPEAVAFYKITYYQRKGEWKNFGPAVVEYMKTYGNTASSAQMNAFAWTVFENCQDMSCVANALDWSRQSFAKDNNHQFMDTYANLLHKSGNTKEAIIWETKAKELAIKAGEDGKDYAETLAKMEKGEKTW
ncbi:MAG: thioredoxin fold domain-containing protein [Chitinophagaceae bacterium]